MQKEEKENVMENTTAVDVVQADTANYTDAGSVDSTDTSTEEEVFVVDEDAFDGEEVQPEAVN